MERLTFVGLIALTVALAPVTRAQYTADFQTNIISGVISNWTGDYIVGDTTAWDVLLIENTGVLINGWGKAGYQASSSNNSIIVSGTGSIFSNASHLYVGYSGSGNSLTISNSGQVFNSAGIIGYTAASNNVVWVTGSGSLWTNGGPLHVGVSSSDNSLAGC